MPTLGSLVVRKKKGGYSYTQVKDPGIFWGVLVVLPKPKTADRWVHKREGEEISFPIENK
jgi:hypothetical protein